jgi:Ras-related GTP-binding protein C/D
MSPHETLFLESTHSVDINWIANNNFVRFQTWDFGGDLSLHHDVMYQGRKISPETIFRNTSTLVYVIDAQEEDYEDSLPKLVETISAAHSVNPQIHFEVFLVRKLNGCCKASHYLHASNWNNYMRVTIIFFFIIIIAFCTF